MTVKTPAHESVKGKTFGAVTVIYDSGAGGIWRRVKVRCRCGATRWMQVRGLRLKKPPTCSWRCKKAEGARV